MVVYVGLVFCGVCNLVLCVWFDKVGFDNVLFFVCKFV